MNLSKTYDCIPHKILITKSEAYGLDKTGLHLFRGNLNDRKRATKIGYSFRDWRDIICEIHL